MYVCKGVVQHENIKNKNIEKAAKNGGGREYINIYILAS